MRRAFWLLAFLGGCRTVVIESQDRPVLVAHRGASHAAPENTLPAYELAIAEGADFFEGDFWLTRDDRLVCLHDSSTRRTAPGQPVLEVQEATLAELRQLDVGAWKGPQFAGTRIPTLEEVLAIIPDGKGVYVELKDSRPQVLGPLKKTLGRSGLRRDQQVVIAFDPDCIAEVKAAMPEVKALWLYYWYLDTRTGRPSNTVDEILHVARAIGADGVDINTGPWVDATFVRRLREAGLEFHVYTVNEMASAARYLALGVDSMTTDRPRGLREEVEESLRPLERSSDVEELLTVHPDGTWTFRPYRH